MRHLLHGLGRIQNRDGGFPEIGAPTSLPRSVWNVAVPWFRHRDLGTLVWNTRKLVRLYGFPGRPFFNNSVMESGAKATESNVFSSWLRYLTIRIAADAGGIRCFDPEAGFRVVGLNYVPEGSMVVSEGAAGTAPSTASQ